MKGEVVRPFPLEWFFFALLPAGCEVIPVEAIFIHSHKPFARFFRAAPCRLVFLNQYRLFQLIRRFRPCSLAILFLLHFASPAHAGDPQRIISMSPGITEILFALGAGDRVVGVTDFCTYPEEACTRPSVGGLLNPNVETWIRLQPDLIVHQIKSNKIEINARNLGIETLVIPQDTLANIFRGIQTIGDALNLSDSARRLTQKLKEDVDFHRNELAGVRKKSVLFLLGDSDDPSRDLYAVGGGTFLGEILELAGGANIVPDPLAKYPRISKEFILQKSPEVIVVAGPKANLSDKELERNLQQWQQFPTLRAVREKNIFYIGADYILIPGPRLVKILTRFARAIHPEVFAEGVER